MRKLGGIHVPHFKNTASNVPERIPVPVEVRIPMSQHIGAPAKSLVKDGFDVKVGQLIGEAAGFVSAPIHASVSGKVKFVEDTDYITGAKGVAVVITADGKQTVHEDVAPPTVTNLAEFLEAVKNSGAVGLGGAGFPTAVKLTVKDLSQIEYILINGAECEPYITSDTRTMIDQADLMREGVLLLQKYLQVKNIVIGIEQNKPEAIAKMKATFDAVQGVSVSELPSVYPQGGEKVLIYNVTKRIVPEGKLPLDAGVIVINCTTLAFIANFIKTGMPLVEKCVTVDGDAISNPKNVIVPIGTPISAVLEYCGLKEDCGKVLMGGPMMGLAVPDVSMPVLKNNNALLAFTGKTAKPPQETPCIRCGRCVAHCPMGLMACNIESAYNLKKGEMLEQYKVNLCMECGCCAYSCPAKRPLVQVIKLSKIMLREYQTQQKADAERKAKKLEKEMSCH
jgi:electron transport complex protein RnfC